MNKRHGMIATALVALLLVTGCSTFFTGGVSGKVKCNGEPVARATVALYFDEGQRNADYDAQDKVFHTQYKTETQDNGSFAITNIPWDSAFPEYGKDADMQTAYALVYHKDYGYIKVDGLNVISGRSNEFFPEFPEKLTKTASVTVKFMNPETRGLESGVSNIKISYDGRPGYDGAYDTTVPVNGGVATFDIVYQGESVPKFNISEIKYNTYDGNKPYAAVVKAEPIGKTEENGRNLYGIDTTGRIDDNAVDANNTVVINTIPLAYEFRGFKGSVSGDLKKPTAISIYEKDAEIKKENIVDTVVTKKSTDRDEYFNMFEGLGHNITLENGEIADYQNAEIKGYPAIIEKEYRINSTDPENVFTATSDPKAVTTVTVKIESASAPDPAPAPEA